MRNAVIVSAVRTPVGKFQGSLQSFSAPQLGALVVREAVRRPGVDPAQPDECIMGCVLQAGLGQNPARQAAIHGGLSPSAGAFKYRLGPLNPRETGFAAKRLRQDEPPG